MQGRCNCGEIRYRLMEPPMFVHCCHCTWCQRETGSAFALNAIIERDRLQVTGDVEYITLPSNSGKGQELARCPRCKVTLFSHYAGAGRLAAFVRVGTLNDPAACPPDIHIYTSTKLPWLMLDSATPQMPQYYDLKSTWPAESQARRAAMKARAGP